MQRVRAIAVDRHGRLLLGVTPLGQYGLIGGKVDEGESELEALRRELREESGVTEIVSLSHLFNAYGNSVYMAHIEVGLPLTSMGDPDAEFDRIELVYFNPDQPPPMDDYSESIIFGWLLTEASTGGKAAFAGKIQVYSDGELVMEFSDDVIWQTMPRLSQLRSKGKKLEFRQVTDDNKVIDFSTPTFPSYFDDYKRVRVMGLDTGIVLSNDSVVGIHAPFGGHTELVTKSGQRHRVLDSQFNLDMSFLDFEDLDITANNPGTEASLLALELLREHFPDCECTPDVVILHAPPFVASTRHNNETGHTYITINSDYLKSRHLRQILAHEVVHYYIYKMFGSTASEQNVSHGELFAELADEINAREGKGFIDINVDSTRWTKATLQYPKQPSYHT